MKKALLISLIGVILLSGLASAGDVTITLVGINPLNINVKGNSQNEEAGSISIFLYFRDDGTTDLAVENVNSTQITDIWGWGTSLETKSINTGSYEKGGHTFTRRLQYDKSDLTAEPDDYWTTGGINAIVCTFTTVGSGHAYIEAFGGDAFTNWGGTVNHTVTYANQDISLPVQMTNILARTSREHGVVLTWRTESETGCAGFHIWRRESGAEDYIRLTQELIPGQGNSSTAKEYEFTDRNVEDGTVYFYKIEDVATDGSSAFYGPVSVVAVSPVPEEFRLSQNYPNPFNSDTEIQYQIPEEGEVNITVYNLLGKEIVTLVSGKKPEGYYTVTWNGRDARGGMVGSGIYFCRMSATEFVEVKKMMLLE